MLSTLFDLDAEARRDDELELELRVTDPDSVAELLELPAGRARHDFAVTALRIGILALQQARGRVDADRIRSEGDRLLTELASRLSQHQQEVGRNVAETLQQYFDPSSGRFNERIERLVKQDGELEQLLERQIGSDGSKLKRTLETQLGEGSPLMEWLSPDAGRGLLAAIDRQLEGQREEVLREFSLDNREGALTRLVHELTERQGKASSDLQQHVQTLVGEFSLDDDGSALSRLVKRVEEAQGRISKEFSLDSESSALARMRRELGTMLGEQREEQQKFREEVRSALSAMQARKEERERTTRHGDLFEQELFREVQRDSQLRGDLASHTGTTTGQIRNCKVGDVVVALGPESAAPGARFVIEAKSSAGYAIDRALAELETARKNRQAEIGLFVFAARHAPDGIEPLQRIGSDVIAIWDAEEPATDVVLHAAMSLCRALCTRAATARSVAGIDLAALDRAVRAVEKQAQGLEEIRQAATTVRSSGKRILERVRIVQEALTREVTQLDEQVGRLEPLLGEGRPRILLEPEN